MDVIKLKFNLKQITPMIHFQNEYGATIRATELKPKLDRFILAWLAFDENFKCEDKNFDNESAMLESVCNCLRENDCYKDWLIDNEHCALNYKMRIKAEKDDIRINRKSVTYGNAVYIVRKSERYKASFYKDIIIECNCFNDALANKIIELLPILIDSTAFGLQQSKGYGNFRLVEIKKGEQKINYKNNIESNLLKLEKHFKTDNVLVYKLELSRDSNTQLTSDYTIVLNAIAEYNRYLKSGLNSGPKKNEDDTYYCPSVIMKKYFKQNIINEKKAMKIKLKLADYNIDNLNHYENEQLESLDKNKIYYTRGLLGFAQVYQFSLDTKKNLCKFKPGKEPRKNNGKRKDSFWKSYKVLGKIGDNNISRFPSPLHYHVTKDFKTIYIIVNNNSVINLQKSKPNITFMESKLKNEKLGKNTCFVAKIPNQAMFDFKDFFKVAGLDKELYMADVKDKSGKCFDGVYFLTKLGDDKNDG